MDMHQLIKRGGGPAKMAKKLGVSRTTIQYWKAVGSIPGARLHQIATTLRIAPAKLFPLVTPPRQQGPREAPPRPAEPLPHPFDR
jgi:DNA-binding transcriptional regulator YdaS (Cro superfamily)